MGVVSKRLSQNKEEQSSTPNKFHSIVLWKTQNQQNKKLPNGNLVAFRRSSASPATINTFSSGEKIYGCQLTIVYGGNANINPTHLSFLIGGTGKHTKGNLKTVIEGWRCRTPRQPSAKKL